jgi:hypothetical protein
VSERVCLESILSQFGISLVITNHDMTFLQLHYIYGISLIKLYYELVISLGTNAHADISKFQDNSIENINSLMHKHCTGIVPILGVYLLL